MIERNVAPPPAGATVAAGLAASLVDFATGRGAQHTDLLARAELDETRLADIDGRVDLGRYLVLIDAARQVTGDPALVLRWAEAVGMAEVSIVGLIMEASATMGEAFVQMQRYGGLAMEIDAPASGPRYDLVRRGGELRMVERPMPLGIVPALTESAFARLVCGPRRFLEQPHVLAVHLAYAPPSYRSEYDRIFRCPVHFNASCNAMTLHPEILGWRVAQYPHYAFGVLAAKADILLAELEASKTVRGQVEAALLPILHEGEAGADRIAAQLGISRQTLFRRLQREDTSFRQVLGDLRQRLASDYLRGGKVSVNETAYLVGFSDPAAFSRAFKRWTGQGPKAFRRQNKGGSAV
ncbi:AraC family transcriptional regulator [Marinicauda pacifica]|uniref:AraC family transcriptional regulator n=2 Tax=Marinicauda pacifica TaxID=1133559 RepID=A0A4S2HAF2_9PROT|nr:AraC family transcriptional regulator [Marinicauda pacifica]